jgi:hypothetical protein
MSAPPPDLIERLIADSQAHLRQAATDYAYLYGCAHQRGNSGQGERVSASSTPDLSDLMGGQVGGIRRDLEDCAKALFNQNRQIQIARARLNDAASRIDKAMPIEPEKHERAVEHPADKGDVNRAKQAQKRRLQRMTERVLPWSRDEVMGG